MSWQVAVTGVYLGLLGILSGFGAHRLWLLWSWWLHRREAVPMPAPEHWPRVTVQLPLFNERAVAERVIAAAGALHYPKDALQIQVLDDSTDDTQAIARAAVEALRARGIDAVYLHRSDRVGFKAGALQVGLRTAVGEIIAIFDADFVPPPQFLRHTVPHFTTGVGMVQARWGHLNADSSWLTSAQSTLLDGHFVIEHTARHGAGRWFNFNGTAGLWRRAAIEAAGGWQHDTLTEDLDLSYRAQLAGWRFVYLDDVVAPAELPPTMAAFKTQQHRWAKGAVQTARKLLGTIWASDAPLWVKLEATVHLTSNLNYPLMVVLAVLLPLSIVARDAVQPGWLVLDFVVLVFAVGPFVAFYAAAVVGSGAMARRRLSTLPVVLALGIGMGISQSRAVFEGMLGPVGSFVRTPKQGENARLVYRPRVHPLVVAEVLLAVYLLLAFALLAAQGRWASLPFLGLFAGGYLAVAWGSAAELLPHREHAR